MHPLNRLVAASYLLSEIVRYRLSRVRKKVPVSMSITAAQRRYALSCLISIDESPRLHRVVATVNALAMRHGVATLSDTEVDGLFAIAERIEEARDRYIAKRLKAIGVTDDFIAKAIAAEAAPSIPSEASYRAHVTAPGQTLGDIDDLIADEKLADAAIKAGEKALASALMTGVTNPTVSDAPPVTDASDSQESVGGTDHE